MAKKKEEKKEEKSVEKKEPKKNKKQDKKQTPQEKYPVLQLIAESDEDTGIVVGALNKKGLYLQFINDLENNNQILKLSKEEFDKIIKEFKYGEL